jgi:murein tripeptide amidase MpaA
MTVNISAAFDSGNIRVVAAQGDRIDLEIVKDHESDFYQWFHFRAAGVRGKTVTFRILNAGGSAYPDGWPGYRTRVSTDRQSWTTTETRYVDGVLEFDWSGDADVVWFAYFAPYSMERHHDLVARIAAQPGVTTRQLGATLDRRPLDCLTLGEGPKTVWLYARQHPGETMAEWWMEGALEWLTDADNADARALRGKATFHIVPNMNPDGSARGHLRTNAAGVNLNREWHEPTPERSPEVLAVRNAMDETGVTFAMTLEMPFKDSQLDRCAGREILPVPGHPGRSFGAVPDQARLRHGASRQGQSVDVDQPAGRAFRRGRDDAGDAVQGP